MLEAEKAGEISKVEDPEGGNGVYYSFRQIKIGVEKGAVTRAAVFGDLMSSLGWSFNRKKEDNQKMKPGKDLPKSVEALLKQAIEAQNKLCQDGMKLMQKPLGLRIIQDTFPTKKTRSCFGVAAVSGQ